MPILAAKKKQLGNRMIYVVTLIVPERRKMEMIYGLQREVCQANTLALGA